MLRISGNGDGEIPERADVRKKYVIFKILHHSENV